jgi:DNA modification methylase
MSNPKRSKIGKTDIISIRPNYPDNYHCECEYCKTNYLGELWDNKEDKYYSQRSRYDYYPKLESSDKHLCPEHWEGYRFAIQNFTKPGDWVLDPMVGTGTSIVESINNERNAVGIELEFPNTAKKILNINIRMGIKIRWGKASFSQEI